MTMTIMMTIMMIILVPFRNDEHETILFMSIKLYISFLDRTDYILVLEHERDKDEDEVEAEHREAETLVHFPLEIGDAYNHE